MKVTFKNREFNGTIFGYIGGAFGLVGTTLSFFDWSNLVKLYIFIGFIILSVCFYVGSLVRVNRLNHIELRYGESTIEITQGDIFSEKYKKDGIMRVFAFNEYFDTKVDNRIISKRSLNGQFINREVKNVDELDQRISEDLHLKKNIKEQDKTRIFGDKHISYKLGTIFRYSENTLLTAMTYFDDENKAKLTSQEYIKFLINFWDEINSIYSGNTVVITLLGNGITRLDDNIYSSNQILEIILWTFYLRRIKFRKPAKLVVLLDVETSFNINYYKIRSMFNGLQK